VADIKEEADGIRKEWEERERKIKAAEEAVLKAAEARRRDNERTEDEEAARRTRDEARKEELKKLEKEAEEERLKFHAERESRLKRAQEREEELRRKHAERAMAEQLRRMEDEERYRAERETREKAQRDAAEKVDAAREAAAKARSTFNQYYSAYGESSKERKEDTEASGTREDRDRDTSYRFGGASTTRGGIGDRFGRGRTEYPKTDYPNSSGSGYGGSYTSRSGRYTPRSGVDAGDYTSYTSSARASAADFMSAYHRGSTPSYSSFSLRRAEAHETRWASFTSQPPKVVLYRDVPFPDQTELCAIAQQLGGGKKAFQKLALRWHPDKFSQRFGNQLDPTDKKRILEKVKEVFQIISTARDKTV